MQKISNAKIINGLLLIACIVQACHAATVASSTADRQLECYVCEDCAKITKETPVEVCDAEFFDKRSTTQEPVTDPMTTTPTTTEMTTESTTTELSTTTTTAETTTQVSTTEGVPTAPTVGPLSSTTAVPTPPTVDAAFALAEEVGKAVNASAGESTTNATNSASDGIPQALALVAEDYTYHCFSVQTMVNGSVSMDRGCSRVTTMESVCGQLKALNNGTELSKCVPCSNSICNGSSALGVSVAALLFTLVAALLSRQ
ncbi:uncharacterized protein LOC129248859 [Anastrepha obliqua]|uniref:uncharacterized protein LOC129248859 n=1 Tax=Anastrepha obliqua TaxID=95512 RepID=UPI0024099CFF|nr:uncharacterized protein LOC129248859 [Anastrepha obliqua]